MNATTFATQGTPATTLVGRRLERRLLRRAIESAVSGHGGCVLIQGEPGIGKSTLLDSALEDAPCQLLRTTCLPGWRHSSFAALLDVIGEHPDLPLPTDGDLARAQAVRHHLEAACSRGPTVLALDDAHWADASSLKVLRHLASRLDELPLVLVLAMRSHDVPDELARLTARLSAQGRLSRVVLGSLDEGEVEALTETLVGDLPGSALLDELNLAGGNPLLVADIVATSRHGAVEPSGEFEPRTEPAAPALLAARPHELAHVSASTWDVLSLAALLGETFPVRALCETLARPMTDLLPAIREAVDAGVLVGVGTSRLGFVQDELRTALYTELPTAVRAELHRDIADRLDRAEAPPSVVAAHLALAALQATDVDWVRRLAVRVVPEEPATAARLWARLRSSVPDSDPRQSACDAGLAEALLAAGDVRRAEVTARRALVDKPEPSVVGSLLLTVSRSLLKQRRLPAARASAESARADIRLVPLERAEQLGIVAVAAALAGDVEGALEAAERGEVAADRAGHPHVRAHALAVRGHCAHMRGEAGLGGTLLAAATRGDALHGPDPSDVFAHAWRAWALADLDRFGEAHAVLDAVEGAARSAGVRSALGDSIAARIDLLVAEGALQRACEAMDESASLGTPVVEDPVVLLARRAWVTHQCGGPAEAAAWQASLVDRLDSAAGTHGASWPYRALAAGLFASKDTFGAMSVLEQGWDACTDHGPTIELVSLGMELAALAAALCEPGRSVGVVHRLDDLAGRNVDVGSLQAAAASARALVSGDPQELMQAFRLWQHSPRRLDGARAAEHVARALARSGHRLLADQVSAEAVRCYVECGATYAAQRARRIRTSGALPADAGTRAAQGWEALTRTERIVARFVERGESNSEIATRLVVSRRTVETHVSHILAKLALRSRSELMVAAARREQ